MAAVPPSSPGLQWPKTLKTGALPSARDPPALETALDLNNLVVARYLDGRVLKGTTRDFAALRPSFHIEAEGSGEVFDVRAKQLKALFFVKSLTGDAVRADLRGFVEGPAETQQGRKLAVRFRDGEFLCGYTLSWSPDREGFFVFPSDPGSNNMRIYVVHASTAEVKAGPAAEVLANRVLAEEKARVQAGGAPSSTILARPSVAMPRPSAIGPRPSLGIPRPSGLTQRPSGPPNAEDPAA
jgi:hypothetical protein